MNCLELTTIRIRGWSSTDQYFSIYPNSTSVCTGSCDGILAEHWLWIFNRAGYTTGHGQSEYNLGVVGTTEVPFTNTGYSPYGLFSDWPYAEVAVYLPTMCNGIVSPSSGWFNAGSAVQFTATDSVNAVFQKWQGSDPLFLRFHKSSVNHNKRSNHRDRCFRNNNYIQRADVTAQPLYLKT